MLAIENMHLLFGAKEVASHETALAALVSELEGIEWERLVVVATYNSDRELSSSVRSSGKFEKEITMNLPNHAIRLTILEGLIASLELKEGL